MRTPVMPVNPGSGPRAEAGILLLIRLLLIFACKGIVIEDSQITVAQVSDRYYSEGVLAERKTGTEY